MSCDRSAEIRADSLIPKVKEAFAQRKPALQNPDQTMSQIGMDSEAFFEVVDEFSKVVKDKIALLDRHIKEESEESIDLQDLSEGATLLRAERVTDILNRLNQSSAAKNPEVIRSIYPMLLRELKAMQHYLTLYSS